MRSERPSLQVERLSANADNLREAPIPGENRGSLPVSRKAIRLRGRQKLTSSGLRCAWYSNHRLSVTATN